MVKIPSFFLTFVYTSVHKYTKVGGVKNLTKKPKCAIFVHSSIHIYYSGPLLWTQKIKPSNRKR